MSNYGPQYTYMVVFYHNKSKQYEIEILTLGCARLGNATLGSICKIEMRNLRNADIFSHGNELPMKTVRIITISKTRLE